VFGLLLAVFVGLGLSTLKTDRMTERMKALEQEAESGPQNTRLVVAQATWEMAQDQLLTGWGAGSFRFYFPVYQLAHPGIIISGDSHKRMRWEHAHDDYLELLAEVGAVGCGLLAAGFLYGAVRLVRLRVWRDPPVAILLLGCLVTMLHATIDFPFFNPAILITWCCLWPLMIRWLEIEQQRRAGGHSLT
jgi:O-antigen ligase